MASTLLAVDDSVTMRKVLEMTFAGEDINVVTADSPDAALQKLKSDKPDLVISDISLDPKNGYDLCKEIKQLSPSTPVILLSSKHNAFDAAKGSSAQVDDHIDKPFDTQQLIDKVKKLLQAPQPATKPAAAPATTTPTPSPAVAARPAAAAAAPSPLQRAKTLIYNPPTAPAAAATPKPAASPIAPTPAVGLQRTPPAAEAAAPAAAAPVAAASAALTQANGQMGAKLEQMGLTPTQVEGVLALSRDVIERVVWEVVPVLAETLIKEEIARLTK